MKLVFPIHVCCVVCVFSIFFIVFISIRLVHWNGNNNEKNTEERNRCKISNSVRELNKLAKDLCQRSATVYFLCYSFRSTALCSLTNIHKQQASMPATTYVSSNKNLTKNHFHYLNHRQQYACFKLHLFFSRLKCVCV